MSGVLVDSSVWVSHFRRPLPELTALLLGDQALCHPLVVLALACGTPPAPRQTTLRDLQRLRQATVATVDETLAMVEREALFDQGCGAVDKALQALAARLGLAHAPLRH